MTAGVSLSGSTVMNSGCICGRPAVLSAEVYRRGTIEHIKLFGNTSGKPFSNYDIIGGTPTDLF